MQSERNQTQKVYTLYDEISRKFENKVYIW